MMCPQGVRTAAVGGQKQIGQLYSDAGGGVGERGRVGGVGSAGGGGGSVG